MCGCLCSKGSGSGSIFGSSNQINGMVYNCSSQPIQYCVYSCYEEKQTMSLIQKPKAGSSAGAGADIGFKGFNKMPDISLKNVNINVGGDENVHKQYQIRHVYEPSKNTVMPNSYSSRYLNKLDPDKCKFSWRFKGRDNDWKTQGGIIRTSQDASIAIYDNYVRDMSKADVQALKKRNIHPSRHRQRDIQFQQIPQSGSQIRRQVVPN